MPVCVSGCLHAEVENTGCASATVSQTGYAILVGSGWFHELMGRVTWKWLSLRRQTVGRIALRHHLCNVTLGLQTTSKTFLLRRSCPDLLIWRFTYAVSYRNNACYLGHVKHLYDDDQLRFSRWFGTKSLRFYLPTLNLGLLTALTSGLETSWVSGSDWWRINMRRGAPGSAHMVFTLLLLTTLLARSYNQLLLLHSVGQETENFCALAPLSVMGLYRVGPKSDTLLEFSRSLDELYVKFCGHFCLLAYRFD